MMHKGSKMTGKMPGNMMMDDKDMGTMHNKMNQTVPLKQVKKTVKKKK